jgi:hypothetical protein
VATKGKKNAKVKWAIGGVEPDDLPDFSSNEDIVKKNGGALPPKGRTRVLVKKVTSKENKNGDQMLMITAEIAEKGSKKDQAYNGYAMWTNQNVTEQGAPYLKAFLKAIGVTWNDFINKTVADESQEPTVLNKIGKVNLNKPVEAWASLKYGEDQQGFDRAEIGRWLAPVDEDDADDDDADDDEDADDDDIDTDVDDDEDDSDDDDDDDDDDSDDEDDDDDEDGDDDDDEDDDAEETLRDELKSLKVPALKKRAIRAGVDEDDLESKKGDLIDQIVEAELGDEDDDDDEDDEDGDGDESAEDAEERIRAELADLDLKGLRDRARANGRKAAELKGAKKQALIKFILKDEIPPF